MVWQVSVYAAPREFRTSSPPCRTVLSSGIWHLVIRGALLLLLRFRDGTSICAYREYTGLVFSLRSNPLILHWNSPEATLGKRIMG